MSRKMSLRKEEYDNGAVLEPLRNLKLPSSAPCGKVELTVFTKIPIPLSDTLSGHSYGNKFGTDGLQLRTDNSKESL